MDADRALLSSLASIVSESDIDALASEGGFQSPNSFDVSKIRAPLELLTFPQSEDYEYMWAIHECGPRALCSHPSALRLYLSALYVYCNKRMVWTLTVQGDYYYMFVETALALPRFRMVAADFLGWLGRSETCDAGYDRRFCLISEYLLRAAQCQCRIADGIAEQLLGESSLQLQDELYVCQRTFDDWQLLFDLAHEPGCCKRLDFKKLFFAEESGTLSR